MECLTQAGTVVGTGDSVVHKRDTNFCPRKVYILVGRRLKPMLLLGGGGNRWDEGARGPLRKEMFSDLCIAATLPPNF